MTAQAAVEAPAHAAVEVLSVSEAVRLLQVSRSAVTAWCRDGVVVAEQVEGQWCIDGPSARAAAARWAQERARRRRPRLVAPGAGEVSAEPLLRLVALAGGDEALGLGRSSAEVRALQRARARGVVGVWAADELAVRVLGMTPWEVWGADWSAA